MVAFNASVEEIAAGRGPDFDAPLPIAGNPVVEKSHRKKHFMSVMSGALIKARLERILG